MKQFFSDKRRPGWLVWTLFGLILLVGAAFRFQALDWDQGQSFHPDERAIIQAVGALNTVVDYGDPKNLFNPRHPVGFPYNGLGFFIPNGADIRPATDQETQLYENAKRSGTSYTLPPNVVLPDQSPPDKAINFWNAAYSPLNPHFFAYGTFPMYAIKFGGFFMSAVTGQDWNEWTKLTLIGRFLSVLWSLGTLTLVFLLGRRIFGPIMGRGRGDAIGLTAMAFMSVAVLDIQLAHYLAFDVPLTFFITLAIYAAIGQMRTGTRWSALRTGLAIGLALACKISAAPVVLVGVIAALLYGLYGSARHSGEIIGLPQTTPLPDETTRYPNAALGRRLLGGTVVNLLIMGGAALVVWFVAMPYAFLDFANWSSRVIEETGMSRGINDFPYTRQYVGSTPFLYQISNLVQWGLGWPLGILALVGFGFGLWRLFGRRYKAELLVFCWLLPYILITFTGEVKFNRYLLPILPLLMVLAARFIIEKTLPSVVKMVSSKTTGSTEEEAEAVPVSAGTARTRRLRPRTWVMGGLGGLAFVWALVWAFSFSAIYRQEHTMNQATRWMYANIPDGASFITEQWDESLPTGIKGINTGGKAWTRIDPAMDIYGDAPNDQKIDYFINQFKQTDYIIITSNRLYATMPKLPWRYPIQIRYYELLFSGKLGYQQVATFTDYPTIPLLNLPVIDDGADESFTVYDHPKVMIFKKVAQYSDDQYKGLFANAAKAPWIPQRYAKPADLPEVNVKQGDGALESTTAGQARYYDIKDGKRVDNAKSLLLDKPVDQLPVIDDIGWFKFANDNQWFAVILWFVLAQVLGLLGLPLMLRVCRRLPDRAYILAKPVGGLVVALVIWLLVWTRQVMNTVSTAYIALALVAVASGWLFWRNHSEILGWIKDHRKLILIEEAIFLVAYLVWIWVRLGNPDLWHPYYGGEKPMEFTHLNGILRSAYFPPYDPWFSDGYINYYYYGQYLVATWIKLTGIEPGIAFNLALPLLYGFVCAGGFSLVYNLATNYKQRQPQREDTADTGIGGPVAAGFFGVFIFAVAGNFDGFIQILQRFQPIVDLANKLNLYPEGAEVVTKFDYFRSTRIIDGTNISEFPFFSFLYGDLHAHLINLPYTLVALALALNLVSANWIGYDETRRNIIQKVALRLHRLFDGTFLLPVLLAALIGFLAATNIWDLPTYLGITGIALFLGLFRRPAVPVNSEVEAEKLRPRFMPLDLLLNLVVTGVVTGGILVLGYALYWNFFSHFQALYGQIAQTRTRSPLLYWLVIFIFPLFILLTYLVWSFAQWIKPGQGARPGDLPPRPTPRYKDDDEDELDEPEDLPLESAPTLQPRPGFKIQLRPELALSYAGADGGFNEGLGGGSPTPPEPLRPVSRFNNFSLPWIGLVGVGLLGFVIVGLVSQQWLVMALGIILTFAAIFLVLAKSFDPNPAQAAEARQPQNLFLRLLIAVSFAIVAGVEFFYLVDDLSGSDSLHRMNTIFKFYYQVWTMLTLGAAFALYIMWQRWIFPTVSSLNLPRMSFGGLAGRVAWLVVLSFLVGSVAVYPVLATPDKWSERASTPLPPPTLDGRAYFDTLRVVGGMPAMPPGKYFDMTYEAQSLHEFYDKIKGTPVVMQMSIWPYRGNGSWISINTGLPTVLGWDHHETQQRYPEEVIRRSETAGVVGCVREFYNTPDITHALQILNHYHVTYVHLGTIERDGDTQGHSAYVNGPDENCLTSDMYNGGNDYEPLMSDEGYDKFDKMVKLGLLEIAYQNPGVTVYKLTAKGEAGVVEGDPNSLPSTAGTASDPKLNRLLQAVNANPSDAQARYDLGQFYFQRRQYDKAAEQLKMVTQLQPKEINPYHVLGDIYAAMGDNERALEAWKQPTIFAPTNPAANNKYGIGLLGNGKAEEAVAYFKKAVQANAHFEEAYFHMGEAYELLNRRDDAILAYEQTAAVATDRSSFWVKRATEQVAKLSGKKP
jgi:uncharacterized membrane protein/Flp pilus assembly protein TadD